MEKTFRTVREVTMLSDEDTILYQSGSTTGRMKAKALFDVLDSLVGLSTTKFTNPKNDLISTTTINSSSVARTKEGFSVSLYAYNDVKYGEYIAYSGDKDITIPENTAVYAVRVYGTSNSTTKATITIDGKTWDLPALDSNKASFAHLFKRPVSGNLSFSLSRASRLVITLFYAPMLVRSMYHEWETYMGGAIYDNSYTPYCEIGLNTALNPGAVVYGNPSVPARHFADLSEYRNIHVECTPNTFIRFLYNRKTDTGDAPELYLNSGSKGVIDVDISQFPYFHLNAIKVAFGSSPTTVTHISLRKK